MNEAIFSHCVNCGNAVHNAEFHNCAGPMMTEIIQPRPYWPEKYKSLAPSTEGPEERK